MAQAVELVVKYTTSLQVTISQRRLERLEHVLWLYVPPDSMLRFLILIRSLVKKYKTIILPVVLWGCEAWSLTLREERRLRGFVNRILGRISGLKRDENGEWRRLLSEELHSLYRSPNIFRVIKSRRLRWVGHVARMKEGKSASKILTGTIKGKMPLGRPRRRWVDNIRMDLK